MTAAPAGTLYVVATPLGHLADVSPRATEVLRAVSLVAAEDTRRTRKLLTHIGARTRTVSYHAHSPPRTHASLLRKLLDGSDVALVTDAGTPGVSDPGTALVRDAAACGVRVVPIPGPTAVVAAVSVSGFSANQFLFVGFLPRRGRERTERIREIAASPRTVVLFESPERLVATLRGLAEVAGGDREVVVARELTKRFEEIQRGTLEDMARYYEEKGVRGEVTLVVSGCSDPAPRADEAVVRGRARALLADGATKRDAARTIAEELEWPRSAVYRIVNAL